MRVMRIKFISYSLQIRRRYRCTCLIYHYYVSVLKVVKNRVPELSVIDQKFLTLIALTGYKTTDNNKGCTGTM